MANQPAALLTIGVAVLAVAPAGSPVRAAQGQTAATPFASEAEALQRCRGLIGALPDLPDAPTEVTGAKVAAADGALPAFCQVTATIRPHVGIELRLPTRGWNHKLLEYARGGYCRPVTMAECDGPLSKGYACVISDDGNQTSKPDDVWAYDDNQAKTDCGFRGTHVAAVAARVLTTQYYGERPRYAYLMGCSTGGRMAMMEATRFPYDFDGIVAGAPPVSKFYNGISLAWSATAVLDKDGRPVLFPDDVRLLHAAVLAACDAMDGLKDGVVSDPSACKFDPAAIQCKTAQTTACLTPDKVEAVRRIYRGPVNSRGEALYDGGPLPGSELTWIGAYVTQDGGPSALFKSMTDMFRNLAYPRKGEDWTIRQLDWDRVSEQVSMAEAFYGAANPDLRRFKDRGGKLIAYHGLTDQLVLPANYAAYYDTVQKVMSGAAATRDFFRLFQVPGLNHCTGGDGAGTIDYLSYLDQWVDGGRAPDVMLALHPKGAEPGEVAFSRPVFPYPLVTRYRGRGDPNAAASFVAATSLSR